MDIVHNNKYYDYKGYLSRMDFAVISLILFIAHRYILYVIENNAIMNIPFITFLCYISLAFVCYARFCAFAKRILDITGEKPTSGFHNLAGIFMALTSLSLSNQFMLWVWFIVFAYCVTTPGKYTMGLADD